MAMTRRALLGVLGAAGVVGGAATGGVVLVDRRVVPGRSALDRVLGRCDIDVPGSDVPVGPVAEGTFTSALRRTIPRFWQYAAAQLAMIGAALATT